MKIARLLVLIIVCINAFPVLAEPEAGDTVIRQGAVKEDLYLAGRTVEVLATVEGDVVAAGAQVSIDNQVTGDVLLAGGNVSTRGRVGDDVRVAGGTVTLAGNIGDDAIAAGGQILLSPAGTVGGRAWLAGNTVTVSGKVAKGLKVAGSRVVINGQISGDVDIYADEVEIQRGAAINGNVTYRAREEAIISSDAKITGTVRRERVAADESDEPGAVFGIARGAINIGLILAGVVLYLLFPVASIGAARTIGESPWKALGLGFASLAATPLVAALLFATIFGVWLAFVALLLYVLFLFIGFLTGVFYIGEIILNALGRRAQITTAARVLAIIAAFVVLWALRFTPVLGGVVMFALMIFGLGALVLYLSRRYVREA